MGFRGQEYAFDSPGAAVAGMLARLGTDPMRRGVESCSVADSRGRILAEAITADRDSPPFDYAAMDGYAVRLAEISGGGVLQVTGEARIGAEPPALAGRGIVRIVTGAAIPTGAEAVIKREDVVEHADPSRGNAVASITIPGGAAARVRPGDNIRRRAENAGAGEALVEPGTALSAAALGTLAAAGCTSPRVYARIRIAIITTGDELVPAEHAPTQFQIRNSNGPAVQSLIGTYPWIDASSFIHVGDDGARLAGVLRDGIAGADAVILTGGVSMGHRDPVRGAAEAAGADVVFHGLPQRPGKPMLGAVASGAGGRLVPVFGLPGNPVSAMVTGARIVIPVLAAFAGAMRWPAPPRVSLCNPDGKSLELWWHRLVRLNEMGGAELVDARGSGDIIAAGRSDGFIEVDPAAAGQAAALSGLYPFYAWPR
jgi:molybdopterin molybdotransferase